MLLLSCFQECMCLLVQESEFQVEVCHLVLEFSQVCQHHKIFLK